MRSVVGAKRPKYRLSDVGDGKNAHWRGVQRETTRKYLQRDDSTTPTLAEADISDFEILCARWLTEQRDFQAKMGHTRGRGFSQASRDRPIPRPDPLAIAPSR